MCIKPIKKQEDYHRALARLDELMAASLNLEEGAELEELSILIEQYESFPNEVTQILFEETDRGENLTTHSSVKELETKEAMQEHKNGSLRTYDSYDEMMDDIEKE